MAASANRLQPVKGCCQRHHVTGILARQELRAHSKITSQTGLKVSAYLVKTDYPTAIKISDHDMQ